MWHKTYVVKSLTWQESEVHDTMRMLAVCEGGILLDVVMAHDGIIGARRNTSTGWKCIDPHHIKCPTSTPNYPWRIYKAEAGQDITMRTTPRPDGYTGVAGETGLRGGVVTEVPVRGIAPWMDK